MQPTSPDQLGGKLGGRLASMAHNAVIIGIQKAAPIRRQVGALVLEDFFDKVSGEIRGTLGPVFEPLADHEATPEQIRPVLDFLGRGNGQWQTFLGQAVAGSALSVGLGGLFSNLLQPVTQRLIAANPHLPVSVSDAARAIATGIGDFDTMRFDAHGQGIDEHRLNILVALSRPKLAPSDLAAYANHAGLSSADMAYYLQHLGYTAEDADRLTVLRRTLIDPSRLADLVTFGVLSEGDAAAKAAQLGMSADDFRHLVDGNGMPPSTQELLFAYRRGVIDRARLLRGITQGPLRNEWFDVVESFGIVPMSTADAVQAAVQGHLSTERASAIAKENGLDPRDFQALLDTAGSPPGAQEMLQLLNRGEMTETEVRQALRETRLKNKYIDVVLRSRFRIPPLAQVRSMVRKGTITPEQGQRFLEQDGYAPDIAASIIADTRQAPTTAGKHLSLGQIQQLYHDRLISKDQAHGMLVALGYDTTEADDLLTLADYARSARVTSALVTRVHHAYVAGLLDHSQAVTALDAAGVNATTRDEDLTVWDIERTTVRRTLTEAQMIQALKKGVWNEDMTLTRLRGLGYSAEDAGVLLAIAATGSKPKPPPVGGQ